MFKQISKTLLIAIVSGVLTTSPVLAQATTQPVVKTDAQGNKTAVETHNFGKVEDSDMLASITMLAIGAIGTRMALNYKPITTDVMIAAAGAAVFIAGEVMSTMSFKKGIEETTMEIVKKKGVPNQEQIEALQKLKESYEAAKKSLKTKKSLQTAAAVAFGAAAAWALYLSFNEVSMDVMCKATIATTTTALTACSTSGAIGNPDSASCVACLKEMSVFTAQYNAYSAARWPPAPSAGQGAVVKPKALMLVKPKCIIVLGSASGYAAGVTSQCNAAIAYNSSQEAVSPVPITVVDSILFPKPHFTYEMFQSKKSPIETFVNFFLPEAQAGMMSLLGLGAGAAAAFFLISGPLGVKLDSMMFVAKNRAIVFAGLAAGAFMASSSTDNVLKKIEENIAKIDKILTELNNMGKGIATKGLKPMTLGMEGLFPPTQTIASFSPDNKTKFPCVTSNSSTCPSMEEQLKNIPGFSQMPPVLQAMANDSTKLADSINGRTGIIGATLNSANVLANKKSAISNLLKKTQKALNDRLKKAGKAPINFDKEQGKFFNSAAATVKKSLAKSGSTPAGFLSSIGGMPIDSSGMGKPIAEDGLKSIAPTTSVGSVGGAPAAAEAEKMDMDFEDTSGAVADAGSASTEAQPEYDMGNQDEIHKDSGPSIFELISSRYLKSGYSKLLEEEPTKN